MQQVRKTAKPSSVSRVLSRDHEHACVYRIQLTSGKLGPWRCAECRQAVPDQARWNANWARNTVGGAK